MKLFEDNQKAAAANEENNRNSLGISEQPNEQESYGTFRKGPYIIADNDVEHVCHRKHHEMATEL